VVEELGQACPHTQRSEIIRAGIRNQIPTTPTTEPPFELQAQGQHSIVGEQFDVLEVVLIVDRQRKYECKQVHVCFWPRRTVDFKASPQDTPRLHLVSLVDLQEHELEHIFQLRWKLVRTLPQLRDSAMARKATKQRPARQYDPQKHARGFIDNVVENLLGFERVLLGQLQ